MTYPSITKLLVFLHLASLWLINTLQQHYNKVF
uniref:Uncharacterized protein n=1 Tax=Rhizophora mucronata TaxID=61149 RepID=A0A2P2NVV3_RHIMU